jgi:double-stranded uracil-DNA glycosylase
MTGIRKVGLPPIVGSNARVLILGTLPGDESLRLQQYYGHPRNHFWPIIAAVLDAELPPAYEDRREMLITNGIAVWDVLQSADRAGSLDSDIRNARANDFDALLRKHSAIDTIAFNGQKARALFWRTEMQRGEDLERMTLHVLPSTSPAYVKPMSEKTDAWRTALVPITSNLTRRRLS